jgi:hypothetical protein
MAEQSEAERRLSATRLAGDANDLAGSYLERHSIKHDFM